MQRVNPYETLKGDPYFDKDTNGCTVVALHVVTGNEYNLCDKYMRKFGRGFRKGMFSKEVEEALISMKRFVVKKGPYTKENRITLKQFLDKHPVGKYYCLHRGHAFAVVDGVLYDYCDKPRRQITCAWRIYKREEIKK